MLFVSGLLQLVNGTTISMLLRLCNKLLTDGIAELQQEFAWPLTLFSLSLPLQLRADACCWLHAASERARDSLRV